MIQRGMTSALLLVATCLPSSELWASNVLFSNDDLVASTDGGFDIHTLDKKYGFSIGGKLQLDATSFRGLPAASQNHAFSSSTDVNVRRGYLSIEGYSYYDWVYQARLDYKSVGDNNQIEVGRLWLGKQNIAGYFNLAVGRYGPQYGIEKSTSSSWNVGLERPALYDFMGGAENPDMGVQLTMPGSNYSLATSFSTLDHNDKGTSNHAAWGYSARATYAPLVKPDQIVHLGVDYHDSRPNNNEAKLDTRVGIRTDQDDKYRMAAIDRASSDHEYMMELAYQYKQWIVQGEYFKRSIDGESDKGEAASADVHGYYGQASWMMGSRREYDPSQGRWKKPENAGSYELFARYEHISSDADDVSRKKNIDNNVKGIKALSGYDHNISVYTAGINYYPNKQVRLGLDYTWFKLSNIDTQGEIDDSPVKDHGSAVTGRLQFVF